MLTLSPKHEEGHHGEHHEHYVNGHNAGILSLVAGRQAKSKGESYTPPKNPHKSGTKQHKVWAEGFKHGQLATHVGVSAKFASNPINYENPGVGTMTKKLGIPHMEKTLLDQHNKDKEEIKALHGGRYGSGKSEDENHEVWKQDREALATERKNHKEKTGSFEGFAPKSAGAKRAQATYDLTSKHLRRKARMIRSAVQDSDWYKAGGGHRDKHIRNAIASAIAPDTVHHTIVSASNPETGKDTIHTPQHYLKNLKSYKDFELRDGGGEDNNEGASIHFTATHIPTNQRHTVLSLGLKNTRGPNTGSFNGTTKVHKNLEK